MRKFFRSLFSSKRKPNRVVPPKSAVLSFERLEDRLAPSAGNLLVSTGDTLFEYTSWGSQVRAVDIPVSGQLTEYARDLIRSGDGNIHVYNGTFAPVLSTYDPLSQAWTERTHPDWNTANNWTYGGIGAFQNYVFATDMRTTDAMKGIIRFNLLDGDSQRFADNIEFQDLTVGLDGWLYGLEAYSGRRIHVYDPQTLAFQRTVSLPSLAVGSTSVDHRGLAVNAFGQIFTASLNGVVYHFDANGGLVNSKTLATSGLSDIDIGSGGRIAIGSVAGEVFLTDETLVNVSSFVVGPSGPLFVALDEPLSLPEVEFAVAGSSGTESVSTATLTLTLSSLSLQAVTVDYAVGGGTATGGGSDYLPASGTVTFLPGELSRTISLTIVDDGTDENDETIRVGLSNPTNAQLWSSQSHLYTIEDNDAPPTVGFRLTNSSGAENAAAAVEIFLSAASERTATVTFTATGGSATANVDYSPGSGTVTFSPGQTSRTIPLAIINDNRQEFNETIELSLSNAVNAQLGTGIGHTYTIVDTDPPPSVSFRFSSSSGSEDATANLEVRLSAASDKNTITVNYAVTGGTATAADYQLAAGTLSFAPGQTSTTITLISVDDSHDELDQTIQVTLSGPVNAQLGAASTHTYTILDNDAPPIVGFALSSSNGGEESSALLDVVLSIASEKTVTVNYAATGGTAAGGGVDYQLTNGSLTFTPGQTAKSISLTVANDARDEFDETVQVTLTGATNGQIGAASHIYTIVDNDPGPTVNFRLASSSGGESASSSLEVTLSGASDKTITISYAVGGGTASGSGVDYQPDGGSVIFSPGQTSMMMPLTIINDTRDEFDETVQVTLTAAENAELGAATTHIRTIVDDDLPPTVSFRGTTSSGREDAPASLEVLLSAVSQKTVTVNYAVTGGTASGNGVDYTLASGTLTFSAGQTVANVAIAITDDQQFESDETIQVTLSGAVNGSLTGTSHTYTIQDNDTPPNVAFQLTASSGGEQTTPTNLAVVLSQPTGKVVTVNYAVSGGSAAGNGVDYSLLSGRLTFNPGETVKNIPISIVNDTRDETDETVVVTLSAPTVAVLGTNTSHTFTILDNDTPPTVGFQAISSTVSESITTSNLAVNLSVASGRTVTVTYAVNGGTATGGGWDYNTVGGTLTFNPGQTVQYVPLSIVNDTRDEPDETIRITLMSSDGATLGANTVHTYNLVDNDSTPTVAFQTASSNGGESASPTSLTVTLTAASERVVTVSYGVTGGTASGNGVDYQLGAGSLAFNPGETAKTISLTIVNDAASEANETVVVTLSAQTNSTLGAKVHTFTILDDDGAPPSVSFQAATASGSEATNPANLVVTLSKAFGKVVTVNYAVTGGTAGGNGEDYTLADGTLTFQVGQTQRSIPVAIVQDLLEEANETLQVTLSQPTNATMGLRSVLTFTILDDDVIPEVSFQLASSSGSEATTLRWLVVELSRPVGRTVTVRYTVTGGTASGNGVDYRLASGTLTFNPGQSIANIGLSIINDTVREGTETVQITLSSPSNAVLGTRTAHVYSILDND